MEEFLIVVLGIGVLALVPAVPVLRRLGKIGVKGSMAVAGAFTEPASTVGHNWHDMVNEAKEEMKAGAGESETASSALELTAESAPAEEANAGPRRSRSRK